MRSRILNRFKNFIATLVLSVSIVCAGVGGSYFSVYEVHASGVLEYSIMASLIEAVMASMGMSFSSTNDLNSVVAGLNNMSDTYPDYTFKGVKIFEALREALFNAKLGATVALPYACIEWLSDWLYGSTSQIRSEASDVTYCSPSLAASGVQVISGDFSEQFFVNNNLFFDLPVYRGSKLVDVWHDLPLYDKPLVVTVFNSYKGTYSIFYSSGAVLLYPQSIEPTELGAIDGSVIDSVFKSFQESGSKSIHDQCFMQGGFSQFDVPNGYTSSYRDAEDNTAYALWFRSRGNNLGGTYNNEYPIEYSNYIPASSTNAQVRVFINSGTRFYDSYEQYKMEKKYETFAPSSAVYGSSSSSNELSKTDEGVVTLQLTDAQLTATIEKAVADALAANPSITEEMINELVSEQVASLNKVQDAVEENTTVVSGILQKVLVAIENLTDSILTGLVSLVVPSDGFIDMQINSIMNRLNGMGIAPFDMSGIFDTGDENPFKDITIEVYGQEVVIVSFAHLDMFLDKFRPAIRGLIALFLIFYSINQFFSLIRLSGVVEGGHVNSMSGSLGSIMSQGDSGRIGQKGELTKR